MDWFILSIAAMAGYGIENFLFKTAAEREKDSLRVNTVLMLTVAVLSGIAYLTTRPAVSGAYFLVFAVFSGATYTLANICKIESFKYTAVSIARPISRMYIAITPIMAFFVFRERISFWQIVGLTLATLAVVILTKETTTGERKRNIKVGLIFAIAAAASTSFYNLIGKSAALTGDILSFMFFSYLFSFIISLLLQRSSEKNPLKHLILDYESTRLGVILGVINFATYYLLLLSLTTGKAMVVFPIVGLGIAVTMALSFAFYKEKIRRSALLGLVAAMVAIVLLK